MAQVDCFTVAGIEMWIYTGDHGPPHPHARKRGHWSARVFFLEKRVRMIQDIRPPDARMKGTTRRAIIAGVEAHRAALLRQWEACQP
jgi:hypothetical protein